MLPLLNLGGSASTAFEGELVFSQNLGFRLMGLGFCVGTVFFYFGKDFDWLPFCILLLLDEAGMRQIPRAGNGWGGKLID